MIHTDKTFEEMQKMKAEIKELKKRLEIMEQKVWAREVQFDHVEYESSDHENENI